MTRWVYLELDVEDMRIDRYYQYLVVNLGDARFVTAAVTKTLNPEWNVSIDLPIVGEQSLLLDCVCWDRDRFGKVRGDAAAVCTGTDTVRITSASWMWH